MSDASAREQRQAARSAAADAEPLRIHCPLAERMFPHERARCGVPGGVLVAPVDDVDVGRSAAALRKSEWHERSERCVGGKNASSFTYDARRTVVPRAVPSARKVLVLAVVVGNVVVRVVVRHSACSLLSRECDNDRKYQTCAGSDRHVSGRRKHPQSVHPLHNH
jgi:hypothetical protein